MAWSEATTEIFKFLSSLFFNHKKQVEKVVRIYDAMNRAITETPVGRFLILKVHNGGAVISPSGELYISVLYEDYIHPFRSVKSQYQRVPADKTYMKMLLEVIDNKRIIYNSESMPEGLMKDIYAKEGVNSAVIYYLGQDRKNIYLGSCGSSLDASWIGTPGQLVTLDLAANIIRQSIK